MRCGALLSSTLFLAASWSGAGGAADAVVGLAVDDRGHQEFHAAICAHYHVPGETVVVIRKRQIPDEHLPVVFFIAGHARVSPEVIVDMRLGGRSWMEICGHFGMTAAVFHVPVVGVYGPPYGRAFGHYRNHPSREWASIRLADEDVVNLVNVKFLSAHHGLSPDEVVRARHEGDSFVKLGERAKEMAERKRAEGGKGKAADHASAGQGGPGHGDRKDVRAAHQQGKGAGHGGGGGGGGRGKGGKR